MSRARCPHGCGANLTAHHLRDTGDATELPDGCCSILFERRTRTIVDTGERRRADDALVVV